MGPGLDQVHPFKKHQQTYAYQRALPRCLTVKGEAAGWKLAKHKLLCIYLGEGIGLKKLFVSTGFLKVGFGPLWLV